MTSPDSPFDVDHYPAVVQVEEPVDEDGPLQDERGQQEVEADGTEAVPLQESHQEAEPDEDHHMYVLKH